MTQAVIRTVPDYSITRLKAVVRELFGIDPTLVPWLGLADPKRLVVVKPNWIQESHQDRPNLWEPVITHPALLLSIVDILAECMKGEGTICLCDAPQTYGNFSAITARGDLRTGLDAISARFPSLALKVIDLRREIWIVRDDVVVERRPNPPDPRGYVKLDLGLDSLFAGHRGEGRYYGADYDSNCVNEHHRSGVHEYLIAGTPMQCDLFINVPKLKSHKKTGITCALKNLVGINGEKNWLPHFVQGTPRAGGDEFAESSAKSLVERLFKKAGQRLALGFPRVGTWMYRKGRQMGLRVMGDSATTIRAGNWRGNDTCWRMALDLNRALLYGNAKGEMGDKPAARRYLVIVDGIVGGEGNGPLCPDPVRSNVLIGGTNPSVVDAVAARTMGFDVGSLPIVTQSFAQHRWPITDTPLDQIRVDDDRAGKIISLNEVIPSVAGGFRPHFAWTNLKRTS
jgi:uncharacterized protein (DUF362 family)